jgi:hypothetical protein
MDQAAGGCHQTDQTDLRSKLIKMSRHPSRTVASVRPLTPTILELAFLGRRASRDYAAG